MDKASAKKSVVFAVSLALAFAVMTWFLTNWDEFKAGLLGDPPPSARSGR